MLSQFKVKDVLHHDEHNDIIRCRHDELNLWCKQNIFALRPFKDDHVTVHTSSENRKFGMNFKSFNLHFNYILLFWGENSLNLQIFSKHAVLTYEEKTRIKIQTQTQEVCRTQKTNLYANHREAMISLFRARDSQQV